MNQYIVTFSARAERQLNELYAYIAEHGGEARADKYVSGLVADCLSLSTFPERGTKRDDIRPTLRTKSYAGRVTIAFSVSAEHGVVSVHGVFYGGQDFEAALQKDVDDL